MLIYHKLVVSNASVRHCVPVSASYSLIHHFWFLAVVIPMKTECMQIK